MTRSTRAIKFNGLPPSSQESEPSSDDQPFTTTWSRTTRRDKETNRTKDNSKQSSIVTKLHATTNPPRVLRARHNVSANVVVTALAVADESTNNSVSTEKVGLSNQKPLLSPECCVRKSQRIRENTAAKELAAQAAKERKATATTTTTTVVMAIPSSTINKQAENQLESIDVSVISATSNNYRASSVAISRLRSRNPVSLPLTVPTMVSSSSSNTKSSTSKRLTATKKDSSSIIYTEAERVRVESLEREESKAFKRKTRHVLMEGLFAAQETRDNTALPLPLFHGATLLETPTKSFQLPFPLAVTLRSKAKAKSSTNNTSTSKSPSKSAKVQLVVKRKPGPRLYQTWLAAQPPLLTEKVYSKKIFWDCGVFGTCARPLTDPMAIPFPLPTYSGEALLDPEQIVDFQLPWDIWFAANEGLLIRHREPPPFIKLRSNIYTDGVKRPIMEQAICECQRPDDDKSRGCIDDSCFNRMMFYECSPKKCACGDLCNNQRFRRHEFVRELEVFGTLNRGFGLRTKVSLQPGQLITEYCGEVMTQRMCLERMNTIYQGHHNFYFLECGNGCVIDAGQRGSDARFANHSCDPNCHIEKWFVDGELRIGLFATDKIEAGTELTYDYNYESVSGMEEPCYCNTTRCRGVIGQRKRMQNGQCTKKGELSTNTTANKRRQRKSLLTTRHQQSIQVYRSESSRQQKWIPLNKYRAIPVTSKLQRHATALRAMRLFLLRNIRQVEKSAMVHGNKRPISSSRSRGVDSPNSSDMVATSTTVGRKRPRSLDETLMTLLLKKEKRQK